MMVEPLLWLYLTLVNVVAFGAFLVDKVAAQNNRWRISEAQLLLFVFAGGSLGALVAQQWLRHKTRKQPFRAMLIGIAVVHIVAAAFYIFRRMEV